MQKKVSSRKEKQNPEEKNRDSKDAMTKGLQAIAYTAGAVAGLAAKTFAGQKPSKVEKSKMSQTPQRGPNEQSGKKVGSSSRKVPRAAGNKKK